MYLSSHMENLVLNFDIFFSITLSGMPNWNKTKEMKLSHITKLHYMRSIDYSETWKPWKLTY